MQTTQQQLCFHPLGDPDVTTVKCKLPKTANDIVSKKLEGGLWTENGKNVTAEVMLHFAW